MYVLVDYQKIISNTKTIKSVLNDGVKFCAVVKANAYGHGLRETAAAIEAAVDYFAVARLEEGLQLRNSGIKKPILILNTLFNDSIETAAKNDLTVTVDDINQIEFLAKFNPKLHIKVDTGMNRLGLKSDEELVDFLGLAKLFKLRVEGIYSHFATSLHSDPAKLIEQGKKFESFLNVAKIFYPKILPHICNTSATLSCPSFHFGMVRVGIGMYGYSDRDDVIVYPSKKVSSKIVETKWLVEGEHIGYDCNFVAPKNMNIAVIDSGYGDGLPRQYAEHGVVLTPFGEEKIVGNMCMDLLMIENNNCLQKGDEVILLGETKGKSNSALDIASNCGTISYEILCNLRNR